MMASSTSAPIPLKQAQHDMPYWQVDDKASARTAERRFAAMSVGNRAAPSSFRNITDKEYGVSNDSIRTEYDLKSVLHAFILLSC